MSEIFDATDIIIRHKGTVRSKVTGLSYDGTGLGYGGGCVEL